MKFLPYPFEKLNTLLDGLSPCKEYETSVLTIGEPQFETPSFIQDELRNNSMLLKKYPKSSGEVYLRESQISFVEKRFGVKLKNSQIIPTFGTREVLFNLPQYLLFDIANPIMAFTNPFYQIYEGSAIASRAKTIYLDLLVQNSFAPEIDEDELKQCDLVIINFPNNPTGATLGLSILSKWVKLALKHNFILINDECYSELYVDEKPPSLLEASIEVGNHSFKNILVVNSISKRSSAPGLRSGFIAGDETILDGYMKYRTYIGCASPLPLQKSASVAWADEKHVEKSRQIYKKNFEIAREILEIDTPRSTFYIWLKVQNALEFTKKLFVDYGVKVLPGEYLGRQNDNGINPAKDYIRIALVENPDKTKDALIRLKRCLDEWN